MPVPKAEASCGSIGATMKACAKVRKAAVVTTARRALRARPFKGLPTGQVGGALTCL